MQLHLIVKLELILILIAIFSECSATLSHSIPRRETCSAPVSTPIRSSDPETLSVVAGSNWFSESAHITTVSNQRMEYAV